MAGNFTKEEEKGIILQQKVRIYAKKLKFTGKNADKKNEKKYILQSI